MFQHNSSSSKAAIIRKSHARTCPWFFLVCVKGGWGGETIPCFFIFFEKIHKTKKILLTQLIRQCSNVLWCLYRSQTKLWEGHVFTDVCLSTGEGPMWPLPMMHWSSLYLTPPPRPKTWDLGTRSLWLNVRKEAVVYVTGCFCFSEDSHLFLPPNRYVFQGAEVYDDDSDLESSDSDPESPDISSLSSRGDAPTPPTPAADNPEEASTHAPTTTAASSSSNGQTGLIPLGKETQAEVDAGVKALAEDGNNPVEQKLKPSTESNTDSVNQSATATEATHSGDNMHR